MTEGKITQVFGRLRDISNSLDINMQFFSNILFRQYESRVFRDGQIVSVMKNWLEIER